MLRLRLIGLGLSLIASAGCLPLGGDSGDSQAILNMVPDLTYVPKEGDRVSLYGMLNGSPIEQVPILSDITAFDKFGRVTQENDLVELQAMEEQKQLQFAPLGTGVFVVKFFDRKHTGAGTAVEVRILDGPQKGRTLFAPLANLARLKRPDPEQ